MLLNFCFLGDDKLRVVMGEATKKDEIFKKVVLPKRFKYDRKHKDGQGSSSTKVLGCGNIVQKVIEILGVKLISVFKVNQ